MCCSRCWVTSPTEDRRPDHPVRLQRQCPNDLRATTEWDGDSWEPGPPLPAGAFEAETTTDDTALPDPANPGGFLTFGEFAINLTVSGILPENGPCVSFTLGDPITRTGNAPNANLEDIVDVEPLNLTNCSSLIVTKLTEPAEPTTPVEFDYSVDELDGAIIQFPDDTEITDTLTVPGDASDTINDLLISPDYVVTETDLPDGWTQVSLICTSFDPIAGEDVTRTLFSEGEPGPDTAFPLAPASPPNARSSTSARQPCRSPRPSRAPPPTGHSTSPSPPVPPGETATKRHRSEPHRDMAAGGRRPYTITETPVHGFIPGTSPATATTTCSHPHPARPSSAR